MKILNNLTACISTISPINIIECSGYFEIDDIEAIYKSYLKKDHAWDKIKKSYLKLPKWFNKDLHPASREYKNQQARLWMEITGIEREYIPDVDELTLNEPHTDPIRFPAGFIRRDELAIKEQADHFIAMGVILKNCDLKPGQWALEYGAGFAQIALQLARLGVNVDTVDISDFFCKNVKEQADFFKVPLTPYKGLFGSNPRKIKYDLILFYEAFHHCLDFMSVVSRLKENLAVNGKLILAGEPVSIKKDLAVPYPWGLRLAADVVAIMRERHWCELGFKEDYLVNTFKNQGFIAEKIKCDVSIYGQGYIFTHTHDLIDMSSHWLPFEENESWHKQENDGRWTKHESWLTLDMSRNFSSLEIIISNHHPFEHSSEINYGNILKKIKFKAGEKLSIKIDAKEKSPILKFSTETIVPKEKYRNQNISKDDRALGVYVHRIIYL